MHKYLQLFSTSWQNGFVYRTSVILWRFRNFMASFMALTVWSLLLGNDNTIVGYTQETAITYIFLVSLLQSVVLSTSMHGLSEFIYSGSMSNLLVKPVSVFGYLGVQEVTDKLKNLLFLLLEMGILWWLFLPTLVLPPMATILLFLLWTVGAIYLNALALILLGSIGFWSPETWAPRFLFFIMLDFTAGKLFPLDILPIYIQKILFLTPLPYLSFVQTQLFLGKLQSDMLLQHTLVFVAWLFVGTFIVRVVWQKGMQQYTAAGQ